MTTLDILNLGTATDSGNVSCDHLKENKPTAKIKINSIIVDKSKLKDQVLEVLLLTMV